MAYNQNMKRLALSLLGGFAVPFGYYIALGLLLLWTKNWALVSRLGYPVRWPIPILFHLFHFGSFPLRRGDRTFLILLVFICNAVLYSIPIYFLLWGFSIRRRKAVRGDLPPDPPQFV